MALNTMKAPKGFKLQRAKIRPDGKLEVSYSTDESIFDETPKHGDAPDVDTTQAKIEFEDDLNGKSPKAKVEKEVVLKPKKGSK